MILKQVTAICATAGMLMWSQEKPAPVPAAPARKPAAAASSSPIDTVIQLQKGGMSESLIIKTLQRQNKPVNPTPAEMLKLQKAGVSENIINALMDPASAVAAPAPAAAPTAAAAAASVPSAAPSTPVSTASTGTECPQPAAVSAVAGAQKRRLAVQAFDYSAVRTYVAAIFGNDMNVGQGIRAMLTAKMGQSKNVVLLEREKLQTIMKEQDLGATNRIKQGTKAKIGGITGADAILLGDIVIFGQDNQAKKSSAGGVGRVLPGWGGVIGGALGTFKKTDKAVVAINLRLVDAESGEVLETGEARGESSRTSTDWGAMAGTYRGAAAANSGMTSSGFMETIIGEATNNAVADIVKFLDQKIPLIGAKNRSIEGRVATVDGCTLYLSVGGNDGVHVGDHFQIDQIIKEVIDPETKEVLDKQTTKLGDLVVGTVRDKTAIGLYGGPPISAANLAKPGYAARLVQQ